jgi:hypothetical protein
VISGGRGGSLARHRKIPRHKVPALQASTKAAIERYENQERRRPMIEWFSSIRDLFKRRRVI